jgi:hypothetical protein
MTWKQLMKCNHQIEPQKTNPIRTQNVDEPSRFVLLLHNKPIYPLNPVDPVKKKKQNKAILKCNRPDRSVQKELRFGPKNGTFQNLKAKANTG